jgi:PKD repeat protein
MRPWSPKDRRRTPASVFVGAAVTALILSGVPSSGSNLSLSIAPRATTAAGVTWTNITPNSTGEPNGAIVLDAHDNELVSSTMTYRNGQWTSNGGPGGNAIAYDPAMRSGGVVVVNSNASLWFFQSGRWTWFNTTGTGPVSASQLLVVYDDADGYLVAVDSGDPQNIPACDWVGIWPGDSCVGTFSVWSLSSNLTWATLASLPTRVYTPDPNGFMGWHDYIAPRMDYDPHAGYVVAINSGGETYSYSGGKWTNLDQNIWANFTANNSGMVVGESFAYDPQLNGSVLFGGACIVQFDHSNEFSGMPCEQAGGVLAGYNSTWILRSGNWTDASGPTDPSPRAGVAMAYDSVDGYLLATGGSYEGQNEAAYYSGTPSPPDVPHETWVFSTQPVHPPSPVNYVAISDQAPTADVGTPFNLSVTFVGGEAPFTYEWSNGTGAWTSAMPSTDVTFPQAGSYSIGVTVTDQKGTYQSSSLNIQVNARPSAEFVFPSAQTVGIAELYAGTGANGTTPYEYSWSFGDGSRSTNASGSHTYAAEGVYLVALTIIDLLGEQSEAMEMVTVVTPILATLTVSSSTASLGQSVWFNTSTRGGLGPFHYEWSGLPAGCSSHDSSTIGCLPAESGWYTVRVNVTDNFPGGSTASVNVTLIFGFVLSISSTTSVVGQEIILSVITAASGLTYSYSGLPPGCVSANAPQLACAPTAAGRYTVTVFVNDSVGDSASRAVILAVAPLGSSPPGGNGTTAPPGSAPAAVPVYEILTAILAAVTASLAISLAAVTLELRRRTRPPRPRS